MSDQPILEVKEVTKTFGGILALNRVSFDIHEGEILGIIGPNGSGKTTLINIILNLINKTSGHVEYPQNKSIKDFLDQTGIQFQQAQFPKGYIVDEIVDMVFQLNNKKPKYLKFKDWMAKESATEKKKLYKLLDLKDKTNRKASRLSGGEKQRLNVLLALINKPSLLILDEITTGLDISAQNEILNYIKKYTTDKNNTLILVSHNINEIEALADRVVILDKKKIVADKTRAEIIKKYKTIGNYAFGYFTKKRVK